MAPNLQVSIHAPHLMHFAVSMTCGCLTEPLIAPFRPLAYRISNGRLPIDLAPLFSYIALMILMRLVAYGMVYLLYGI